MTAPLKIAILASEAVPFVKSGGLADVAGALPKALRALGHDAIVILPKYSHLDAAKFDLRPFLNPLGVWMGNTEEWCAVETLTHAGVPFYFIEFQRYFDRFGLYHDRELEKYSDNGCRFGFCRKLQGS